VKSFRIYILVLFVLSILSCRNDSKYCYAIKDFKKSVQPALTRLVSKGIAAYNDSTIKYVFTDGELKKLAKSEHPVLRAIALNEMLNRETFNAFDIVMDNLDDTAEIKTDEGEFGIGYRKVADYVLESGKWKNIESKNKTIDKLILTNNYLNSAYYLVEKLEPQEKYYASIKNMAKRNVAFNELEYCLYGLAKYRKNEDTAILKKLLDENYYNLSGKSFKLMAEFPNDNYLDIYEIFYRRIFYNHSYRDYYPADSRESFVNSIATYKNERSSKILERILNEKPHFATARDNEDLEYKTVYAIWNNKCSAYSKIMKQTERKHKKLETQRIENSLPEPYTQLEIDTIKPKTIGWR
jgi:hypothetical protein